MLRIYKFAESCLPTGVYDSVTYGNMNADEKGVVGIFLYQSTDDEQSLNKTLWESVKIQIQVNVRDGEAGIQEVSDYLRSFVKNIESCKTNEYLSIVKARHIGPKAIPIGLNDCNISIWRCVIDLKYNFK